MGAFVMTADREDRRNLRLPADVNVLINVMFKGGPSDLAGVQPCDAIVRFDGVKITDVDQLIRLVRAHKSGDAVRLVLYRAGKQDDLTVVVMINLREMIIPDTSRWEDGDFK